MHRGVFQTGVKKINVFWQFKSLRKPRGWVETSRNAVGKGNTNSVNNAHKANFLSDPIPVLATLVTNLLTNYFRKVK